MKRFFPILTASFCIIGLGGSVGELLEGQEHSGADLSAEAYDAEARREYGEKALHDISLSSSSR